MAFSKINGVGGDCRVAVVKQDADVVTGHPGKEAVISETQSRNAHTCTHSLQHTYGVNVRGKIGIQIIVCVPIRPSTLLSFFLPLDPPHYFLSM